MSDKRMIYANDIEKVADHAYDQWNLAMAAADRQREINLCFKRQDLCKAVAAVAKNAPTIDPETLLIVRELRTKLEQYENEDKERLSITLSIEQQVDKLAVIIPQLVERAEKAEKERLREYEQLKAAKRCVAGLSMLLKAVDGKMVMETVLPIAKNRLTEYCAKYPSANVVLDEEDFGE